MSGGEWQVRFDGGRQQRYLPDRAAGWGLDELAGAASPGPAQDALLQAPGLLIT